MLMTQPGRKRGEELREPHDQAGEADDEHAPEHGEVVELLPVGPAVELGLRRPCRRTTSVGDEIPPVLQRGDHRVRAEDDAEDAPELDSVPVSGSRSGAAVRPARIASRPARCRPK